MKIKKIFKNILCIFLLIASFNFQLNVEAASFKFYESKSIVSPNSTFTVTVGGECVGRVNLTVENGTLSTSSVWIEDGYETITVKAGSSGKVKVTATPVTGFSDLDGEPYTPGSKSITVTISSGSTGSGGGGTTTPSTPKSGDNALKSLTVNVGTLTPSFNPSVTDYTLALGPDISKINVNGIANHQKASVSGNGDMDLTVGENIIKITVTAENGNPKVYKITAIVDDAPLVFVKFNDKELGVVRNLLTIPALSGFEPTTVKIEDKEINAWYSQTRNITVLYLQDENSKDFYLYDEVNGITSKYVPHTINGNQLGFIDIPKEIQEKKGFTYQEVIIDDKPLMGWVFNNESFANYALIYAMNENGQFNYYQYETTQKSLQLFSNAAPIPFDEFNEELNKKDNEIDTYKMYFYCACGAAAFLFVCLIISIINSNRYKKRLIAKTNRENKVD